MAPHSVSVWETPLKTVILFVIPSVGANGTEITHFGFKLGLRKYFNIGKKLHISSLSMQKQSINQRL